MLLLMIVVEIGGSLMIGIGYDIHRLAEGESMIIGGVELVSELGTVAHSDGDVMLHAIMDALLGAASLGDIGEHFPDTDPKFKNANSAVLLDFVCKLLSERNFYIVNIDTTLILEKPKIKKYKERMKHNIAKFCNISDECVNIKATTNELIGSIGRSEGVAAIAVCQLEKKI